VSAAPSAPLEPPPPPLSIRLHREIEAPTTALALEAPPHAAALGGDAVWIHDARGWRREALPGSALRAPAPRLDVFYGRDDRVRVVGTRGPLPSDASVYLRWKPGGFVSGRGEIGRFADLRGGLVSVLGTKDPEIVCRPGDQCIVKRRTGWTFVPAPPAVERVVLGGDVGWALGGDTVYRLGDAFRAAGPAGSWAHADDLFALPDRAWVIETATSRVHALEGAPGEARAWRVTPAPIPHPRAMWGTSPSALWLVGDGIAYFDGARWSVAADAGTFAVVAGRGADDLWVAGPSGVYRVEAPSRGGAGSGPRR
jgi:hypothetical protein